MTRIFFLSSIVLLVELFTWVLARGLCWWVAPYLTVNKKVLTIALFILSHVMLGTLFIGKFRFGMGYLAILWLFMLSTLMTLTLSFILNKVASNFAHNAHVLRAVAVASFGTLIGLTLYNAYTPTVRHLSITIDKPITHPVKVALVSDLHLGTLFGSRQLYQLADILQRQQVDALLMAGDIMDDDTHVYDEHNMKVAFEQVVQASGGKVYASLGNHDLYNPEQRFAIASAIRATGTVLLDDKVTTTTLGGTTFNIVGRFDEHAEHRLPTAKLLEQVDSTLPTILLDHRPSEVDSNAKLAVDLQVSGHTHNGQIFPANFIVKALNTVSYGHAKLGTMDVVVSSGLGFWGVPFRLGSQSEIWLIEIGGR